MRKRKICVVTSARADYGLLYWLMKEIQNDPDLHLQVVACAMHLSPEFGLSYKTIESDGFHIDRKIEMLLSSDTASGVVKSIGIGLVSFSDALQELMPDIVVVLGDRFEILAPAIASVMLKIPLAHIHGGETSQGAVDEAVRHSITKMASIHFPATETYRQRILQMGENPSRVFNYGAPGLDSIFRLKLLNRQELEEAVSFQLSGTVALVTYHPETLMNNAPEQEIEKILLALKRSKLRAVFTKANADAGGRAINKQIERFCDNDPLNYRLVDSLGQVRYLSCLSNLDIVIGNSSSGLIEAPSFAIPVVNIGDRQKGRLKAGNVIDVRCTVDEICDGINKGLSREFKESLRNLSNPYAGRNDGKSSLRIKDELKRVPLDETLIRKTFCDLPSN